MAPVRYLRPMAGDRAGRGFALEILADALRFVGLAVGVFVAVNVAGEAIRGPFDTVPQWITLPGPRWLRLLTETNIGRARKKTSPLRV